MNGAPASSLRACLSRAVGHEQERGGGLRPLPEPPEPLGEARAVGGRSLPDDGDGPPVGKGEGRVHRHGAIPAEADGVGQGRYGGGDPVDDANGVQPLQEEATPLVRDGSGPEQPVHPRTLLPGQPSQPVVGEAVAAGRRRQLRGVGHRGRKALALQRLEAPVDRAPRPAGDCDGLQPVEKGHVGEEPQGIGFDEPHSSASPSSASWPDLPVGGWKCLLR